MSDEIKDYASRIADSFQKDRVSHLLPPDEAERLAERYGVELHLTSTVTRRELAAILAHRLTPKPRPRRTAS